MINIKQSNPIFNSKRVKSLEQSDSIMTLDGAIFKSVLAIVITLASAICTYSIFLTELNHRVYLIGGGIAGFVMSLITIFSPRRSDVTAPIYAVVEGVFLAAFSYEIALYVPGLPWLAVLVTGTLAFGMLILYRYRIIKVTQKFRSVMISAMMGLVLVYLISMVMNMFGMTVFHQTNSMVSILFSVVVVAFASLSLLLDFDNMEQWAAQGMPKYMEWYAAFGVLITLVWLYLEVLRLLLKLSSRD